MTSPLRRKRQTTAPNTLPATIRDRKGTVPIFVSAKMGLSPLAFFLLAGFLLGALAGFQPALADSDDPAGDQPAAKAAVYSTGKAGNRLKWVGQRTEPAQEKAESEVKPTQYVEPEPACEPSCEGVRTAQDLQPSTKTWSKTLNNGKPAPAEKLGNELTPSKKDLESKSKQFKIESMPQYHALNNKCPSPKELKRIDQLSTDIDPPKPPSSWTEDNRGIPLDCPLGNEAYHARSFTPITYTWTASALCHKPLYFEDVQLERYGHMAGPWVQPFASAANFFCTFPILPYKMGLELPGECVYTLGYYQPGSCAPYLFDPLPFSVRGLFFEGAAWVGACAMFP
jgi:hypothetical protein